MTRRQFWVTLGAFFVVALLIFMPLGLALSLFGLRDSGLTARNATGTIWSGRLVDAHFGRLALGDVAVGVSPFPLFAGRARAWLRGPMGQGALVESPNTFGVDSATAKLATAQLFAPVPLSGIDLEVFSVLFRTGRCEKADGRVRATFAGDVAGLSLAQGLSGTARCEGGALFLPLVSQSTMERLNLRIMGDGSYHADFVVKSTDPALAAKLAGAGFRATQGGYALRLNGSL